MSAVKVLFLICFSLVFAVSCVAQPPMQGEWQSLFNGRDLTGWVQKGGKARYHVEKGAIVGTSVLKTPNSFLCTEKDYADFILEFEFKASAKLNSGVQIRSQSQPEYRNGRVHGYQCELEEENRDRDWSAGIYDEGRRGWLYPSPKDAEKKKAFSEQGKRIWKKGDWNHVRVIAVGDSIKTWLNGEPRADLKDDMTASGFIGLQVHGTRTAGLQVRWRNIRIRELKGSAMEKSGVGDESLQPVLVEEGKVVKVAFAGKPFTAYHYADADRPYFYPLLTSFGDNITRNWPMKSTDENEEKDHKHHRSLWFTHGAINGHDFWTEGRGPRIVQTSLDTEVRNGKAVITAQSEWRAKDGKIVCTDVRKHEISASGDSRLIDFEITIKASHGRILLGDTKEGSMAVRVAATLRARGKVGKGHMLNSEGGTGKDIWGKRARWCDYYGPLNGRIAGVAIMDHPENPRHPTWWHARDYGLCTANPFGLSHFEKKPRGSGDMEIEAGKSVTFKYRVVVHNGTPEESGVEEEYQKYAKQ